MSSTFITPSCARPRPPQIPVCTYTSCRCWVFRQGIGSPCRQAPTANARNRRPPRNRKRFNAADGRSCPRQWWDPGSLRFGPQPQVTVRTLVRQYVAISPGSGRRRGSQPWWQAPAVSGGNRYVRRWTTTARVWGQLEFVGSSSVPEATVTSTRRPPPSSKIKKKALTMIRKERKIVVLSEESMSRMQDEFCTDETKGSVPTSRSEVELPSQPDPLALRPDDLDEIEAPRIFPPETARTFPVREKAMTASMPGTEYWLP